MSIFNIFLSKKTDVTPLIKVKLSRDSVCMGDDCNAPNAYEMYIKENVSLKALIAQVKKDIYLAQISGGKAT